MACYTPSAPEESPWLRLKKLADDFNNIPDSPLSTLQDHYNNYKLEFFDVMTLASDIAPWQIAFKALELANTQHPDSMRAAVGESLGLIPSWLN